MHAYLFGITRAPHGHHMDFYLSHLWDASGNFEFIVFPLPPAWSLELFSCTQHGYHMHTTWVSHAHHMAITCTPHGHHMDFSCGTLAANLNCLPDPTRLIVGIIFMHTTWVSHAHHMDITCTPHGCHMYTAWISHTFDLTCEMLDFEFIIFPLPPARLLELFACTPHGYHIHTTGTPHGYHMHTTWLSHVHRMDITYILSHLWDAGCNFEFIVFPLPPAWLLELFACTPPPTVLLAVPTPWPNGLVWLTPLLNLRLIGEWTELLQGAGVFIV